MYRKEAGVSVAAETLAWVAEAAAAPATRDNGRENGNYYSILGLYRDNGKENGVLLYSPET